MSAHTPGPWCLIHTEGESPKITAVSPRGLIRAVAYLGGFFTKTRTADARLIAAAPELLAALQALLRLAEDRNEVRMSAHNSAIAAIAKATEAS